MKKTNKRAAKFSSEDKERRFWVTHSALDYFDTKKGHTLSIFTENIAARENQGRIRASA